MSGLASIALAASISSSVQGSRIKLAGDDPEHVIVVPGGLPAPTAKAGLAAAIGGDEVEGDLAEKGKVAAAAAAQAATASTMNTRSGCRGHAGRCRTRPSS